MKKGINQAYSNRLLYVEICLAQLLFFANGRDWAPPRAAHTTAFPVQGEQMTIGFPLGEQATLVDQMERFG
ncbi:MAG: hypothetical protein K0R28_223 [Paenibacillus sp.]|jgi:hypothetical protein|nr:hypothetical protein [Paenibacillus sp.]